MTIRNFKDLRPGQRQIPAAEFNRAFETVERLTNFVGPDTAADADGILTAPVAATTFWAQIVGRAAGEPVPHSWRKQQERPDGLLEDDNDGLAGFPGNLPAYALDGNAIDTGTYVRLYRGIAGDYFLAIPSGTGAGTPAPAAFLGCKYLTGTTTIIPATNAAIPLAFADQLFDTSVALAPGFRRSGDLVNFYAPADGYYHVGLEAKWLAFTGAVITFAATNGLLPELSVFQATPDTVPAPQQAYTGSTTVRLNQDDVFNMVVGQTNFVGGSLTLSDQTALWIYRIG